MSRLTTALEVLGFVAITVGMAIADPVAGWVAGGSSLIVVAALAERNR